MTARYNQLIARHLIADNSCETTHCSNYSLQRQLLTTTNGCDDEPSQMSVCFSFWTILSPPTLAGQEAVVAFNHQGIDYQFLIFEMLKIYT